MSLQAVVANGRASTSTRARALSRRREKPSLKDMGAPVVRRGEMEK
jgi:hypothetical protein